MVVHPLRVRGGCKESGDSHTHMENKSVKYVEFFNVSPRFGASQRRRMFLTLLLTSNAENRGKTHDGNHDFGPFQAILLHDVGWGTLWWKVFPGSLGPDMEPDSVLEKSIEMPMFRNFQAKHLLLRCKGYILSQGRR